jgi:hypothetical protein
VNITTEDLEKVNHIVSHYNCADGTVSAMICSVALSVVSPSPKIDFEYYQTKQAQEMPALPGMMFVDFTPPLKRWHEFRDVGTIVVDHHSSAMDHVTGDKVIFDRENSMSGALLCYHHVMLPMAEKHGHINAFALDQWKYLATHISIYDTWQQKHERWGVACDLTQGVLWLGIKAMMVMAASKRPDLDLIYRIGHRWNDRVLNKARQMCDTAIYRTHAGLTFGYVNNTEKITSEIGDLLGEKVDVVVIYNIALEDGKIKMQCSFRSRKGFDTRRIATRFGGGGHVGSSGSAIVIDSLDLTSTFESIEHYATLNIESPAPK